MYLPSGENFTLKRPSVCPLNSRISLPVAAPHSRAVPSTLAVTTKRLSGERAAEVTARVCPSNFRSSFPLVASHNRAVLSSLPVRTYLPSRENETDDKRLQ